MAVNPNSNPATSTHENLSSAQLAAQSILRHEGTFANNGAIVVETEHELAAHQRIVLLSTKRQPPNLSIGER